MALSAAIIGRGPAIQTMYDIPYANNLPPIDLSQREKLPFEIIPQLHFGKDNANTAGPIVMNVDPNLWRYNHAAELTPYYHKNPSYRGHAKVAPLWLGGYNKVNGVNSEYQYRAGRI